MKKVYRFLLLILVTLLVSTCQKVSPPQVTPPHGDTHIPLPPDSISYNYRDGTAGRGYLPADFAVGGPLSTYLYDNHITLTDVWVEGYIVGYVNGNTMTKTILAAGEKETNIILANTADETNVTRLLPIQLSNSTVACQSVRKALNLKQHPENLYRKIKIHGEVSTYMSVWGLKNADDYVMGD